MSRTLLCILFLVISNVFMIFAWYGHLPFAKIDWFQKWGTLGIILISWFIALFEFAFMVPANKMLPTKNGNNYLVQTEIKSSGKPNLVELAQIKIVKNKYNEYICL